MTKRFASTLAGIALALAPLPLMAKAAPPVPPAGAPRLIVAISVDQFSADLFAQYRRFFTAGLARLQDGAVFPNAFQSHAATETCPGHSTILTGAHPSRTGIIANYWWDSGLTRADKRIYCVEDETNPASTSGKPVVSAAHLLVPTLGELLKNRDAAARNVAVSAKDRAVVMMGGHAIDAGWWFDKGQFRSFEGIAPSPAVGAVNLDLDKVIRKGLPAMTVPPRCLARAGAVPAGSATPGDGRFALPGGDPGDSKVSDAFKGTPAMDAATVRLALALAREQGLGQDAVTDVLAVSLSATDYVGHGTGTQGTEMCIQMSALDRAVGDLLAGLDALGTDYVVVLTADHGGIDMVERLERQGYPAARRARAALGAKALAKSVGDATGIDVGEPLIIGDGIGGDYYLSKKLDPAQRQRVMAALVATLSADPDVREVLTGADLAAMPAPAGAPQDLPLAWRARESYLPGRSGDVVALLDRGISPIATGGPGYVSTHGSPWDYDRRVPLMFWRKGLTGFEQPAPVETVDIAPTLAHLAGLPYPAGQFDGRCLDLDAGADDTCGGQP